jgi:hypothetical protein
MAVTLPMVFVPVDFHAKSFDGKLLHYNISTSVDFAGSVGLQQRIVVFQDGIM